MGQQSLEDNLSICTYNIHGYNDAKRKYVLELLNKYSILIIEEHWLNEKQLCDFTELFAGYCVYGVTAMDSTEVLQGRPHGGVVVIYSDSLGSTANNIKTVSKRLCAISLQIHCISLYLFCVYMPVDCNDVNNLEEFENILSEISMICLNNNAEYVCIAGDMNTDLSRTNSWHTKSVLQFIDNENLYNALRHPRAKVAYTYVNSYTSTYSTIDHIFMSKSLSTYIDNYYTLCEEVENQSDHDPVILTLKLNFTKNIFSPQIRKPRKKWNQVNANTVSLYQTELDRCLSNIAYPVDVFHCKNLECRSISHFDVIHKLHDAIISASIEASEVIPNTTVSNVNSIPG